MHLLHIFICIDSRCVWQNYRATVILIKTIHFKVLTKIGFGFRAIINSMHSHVNKLFVEIIYGWIMIGWSNFKQYYLFSFCTVRSWFNCYEITNLVTVWTRGFVLASNPNPIKWQFDFVDFVKLTVNQNIHLLIYSKTHVLSYLIMFNFFM
jgi:hypothetical protein